DDDWLFANKGFRIADARAVVDALSAGQDDKLASVIERLEGGHPAKLSFLPCFTFSLEEIAAAAAVPPVITAAVLAVLTAPEAPTNADFRAIGDFNLASARPLLRTPTGDYVALEGYALVEALYDSPYYWMVADKAYRNTASQHRGDFTETLVARRLAA